MNHFDRIDQCIKELSRYGIDVATNNHIYLDSEKLLSLFKKDELEVVEKSKEADYLILLKGHHGDYDYLAWCFDQKFEDHK